MEVDWLVGNKRSQVQVRVWMQDQRSWTPAITGSLKMVRFQNMNI